MYAVQPRKKQQTKQTHTPVPGGFSNVYLTNIIWDSYQ